MAIVIEQEKQGGSRGAWIAVVMWLAFIAALAAGFYYVFVKKPDVIPLISAPAEFRNAEQVSKLPLDPGKVVERINSSLKNYVTPEAVGQIGRSNPFLP